jgi:hypothetical protein
MDYLDVTLNGVGGGCHQGAAPCGDSVDMVKAVTPRVTKTLKKIINK